MIDCFVGRLVRSPFKGAMVPVTINAIPLRTAREFETLAGLKRDEGGPVYVGFSEYYEILSYIASSLHDYLPALALLLVEIRMPSGQRIPDLLLADDTLLCTGAESLAQELATASTTVVVVRDSFRRHLLERGDNRIELLLFGSVSAKAPFMQAANRLAVIGIVPDRGIDQISS